MAKATQQSRENNRLKQLLGTYKKVEATALELDDQYTKEIVNCWEVIPNLPFVPDYADFLISTWEKLGHLSRRLRWKEIFLRHTQKTYYIAAQQIAALTRKTRTSPLPSGTLPISYQVSQERESREGILREIAFTLRLGLGQQIGRIKDRIQKIGNSTFPQLQREFTNGEWGLISYLPEGALRITQLLNEELEKLEPIKNAFDLHLGNNPRHID